MKEKTKPSNVEKEKLKPSNVEKVQRRRKRRRIVRLVLLLLLLLIILIYVVMSIIYNSGNFSVLLDRNLYLKKGLIIYEHPEYKVYRSELYAETLEFVDNIKYTWLDFEEDLTEKEGSHNGKNYIAYSFYIENQGEDVADYWSEIVIDESTKNVDEAIRIRVYKDREPITYAKIGWNNEAEIDTTPFFNSEYVDIDHVEEFKPGEIIKYTIVIWIEGSDPECTDNILGGQIKLHMDFKSEVIEIKGDKYEKTKS